MDRQWIHIKGRKLLCKEFIYSLDGYVLRKRGDEIRRKCNHMLYVLQVLTDEYLHNENYIEDHWSDFLKEHYMDMPVERKLPEALEVLCEQMESKLNIDLTEMLDRCAVRSNETYMRIQEAQKKEDERILLVNSLIKENKIDESQEDKPESRIRKLLLLQKSKAASNLYELDEKEISIARTWCEVLVSSVFSETIPYGLMLRLVENAIATESEISDLLKDRYHIEKDYEWYSEDFLGCKLDTPTEIRTEDVLSLYAERVEKIIGTKI